MVVCLTFLSSIVMVQGPLLTYVSWEGHPFGVPILSTLSNSVVITCLTGQQLLPETARQGKGGQTADY